MGAPERRPAPAIVAALDQLQAAATEVARVLGTYRRALIQAGFDADEALELCLDLQRAVLVDELVSED